jgi:DNA-binding transcriptional LysR family regulator
VILTPTDLRILLGLAAAKTQAEIGDELHLEQPAISKLLRGCEARTGLTLVEQTGRRLALTPVGAELAAAGARALATFDDLERLATALRAGTRGRIRIIASSTPGSYVLPPIVGDFLRAFPGASVQVQILPINSLWPVFEAERYDLAVVPLAGLPAGVVGEPLYNDPIVFFAAPNTPIARRPQLALHDLADELVVGKFNEDHWDRILASLQHRGFRYDRLLTVVAPEAVKRIVAAGAGVGVLLASSVERELRAGRLVRLPLADDAFEQLFTLARRPNDAISPIAAEFIRLVQRRLARGAETLSRGA